MERVLSYENVHAKAISLLEGGVVEVGGKLLQVVEYLGSRHPCDDCELNGACGHPINDVCAECDLIKGRLHYLSVNK